MKTHRTLFLFLLFASSFANGQNVGINNDGSAPHVSAILDVKSANKGLMVPRVALTGINDVTTIPTPATSLVVFNTATSGGITPGFYYWAGSSWMQISTGATTWSLTGNAATNPANHFIGTTDDQPLVFKINNSQAGRITNTSGNVFFGYQSGIDNNSGAFNAAYGHQSLSDNINGYSNTAIGPLSLFRNTGGNDNTAIGNSALYFNINGNNGVAIGAYSQFNASFNSWDNTNTSVGYRSLYGSDVPAVNTGAFNTAIGREAMYANALGSFNTACGVKTLYSNTEGDNNVAMGSAALYSNSTGAFNTAIGARTLLNNLSGISNTAAGFEALYANTGSGNSAGGYRALYSNTTGGANTAVGHQSLMANQTGNMNTAIGYGANVSMDGLSNATAIGANAIVSTSNSLVLGSNGVKVGIGVSSPLTTLHVKGSANFFDGGTTHTGDFYAGTSNVDGIELASAGNDAFISIQRTSGYGLHISKKNIAAGGGLVGFFVNGSNVGSITTTGATTSYLTTSDVRLKENITATRYSLNTLMKINVEDYNYISDPGKVLHSGFLAQELYTIYPQAVHVGGDDTKTNPWMIDYSKLTPLLVKSIQQQQDVINTQDKKINELETQIKIMKEQIENLAKTVQAIKN